LVGFENYNHGQPVAAVITKVKAVGLPDQIVDHIVLDQTGGLLDPNQMVLDLKIMAQILEVNLMELLPLMHQVPVHQQPTHQVLVHQQHTRHQLELPLLKLHTLEARMLVRKVMVLKPLVIRKIVPRVALKAMAQILVQAPKLMDLTTNKALVHKTTDLDLNKVRAVTVDQPLAQ